jgi:hypothetical protein
MNVDYKPLLNSPTFNDHKSRLSYSTLNTLDTNIDTH